MKERPLSLYSVELSWWNSTVKNCPPTVVGAKGTTKPKAAAEGLACSFFQKDKQARKRSAARSMSDRHRIAGWVVPSVKADDSVAEQCLRGFSRVMCRVQVEDTGYEGLCG